MCAGVVIRGKGGDVPLQRLLYTSIECACCAWLHASGGHLWPLLQLMGFYRAQAAVVQYSDNQCAICTTRFAALTILLVTACLPRCTSRSCSYCTVPGCLDFCMPGRLIGSFPSDRRTSNYTCTHPAEQRATMVQPPKANASRKPLGRAPSIVNSRHASGSVAAASEEASYKSAMRHYVHYYCACLLTNKGQSLHTFAAEYFIY